MQVVNCAKDYHVRFPNKEISQSTISHFPFKQFGRVLFFLFKAIIFLFLIIKCASMHDLCRRIEIMR